MCIVLDNPLALPTCALCFTGVLVTCARAARQQPRVDPDAKCPYERFIGQLGESGTLQMDRTAIRLCFVVSGPTYWLYATFVLGLCAHFLETGYLLSGSVLIGVFLGGASLLRSISKRISIERISERFQIVVEVRLFGICASYLAIEASCPRFYGKECREVEGFRERLIAQSDGVETDIFAVNPVWSPCNGGSFVVSLADVLNGWIAGAEAGENGVSWREVIM